MLDIASMVASRSAKTWRVTAALLSWPSFEVSTLFIEWTKLRNVLKYLEKRKRENVSKREKCLSIFYFKNSFSFSSWISLPTSLGWRGRPDKTTPTAFIALRSKSLKKLIHSHSLTHWLTDSLTHSFIHSLILSLPSECLFVCRMISCNNGELPRDPLSETLN